MSMEAWLDYTSWSDNETWDDHEKNLSPDRILVRENQTRLIESLTVSSSNPIGIISNNGIKITDPLTGRLLGALAEVSSATGQDAALALVGSVDWIVLRCIGSWQMIPVENLIAACDGTGTKLAVFVNTLEDLPGILYSLELGPHAVIMDSSTKLWDAYDTFKLNENSKEILSSDSVGKVHEDDSGDAEGGLLTAVRVYSLGLVQSSSPWCTGKHSKGSTYRPVRLGSMLVPYTRTCSWLTVRLNISLN